MTREVEAAILAQQELVKDIPDVYGKRYLFRIADGLYSYTRFWAHLNYLARDVPILGPSGQVFHFRPHEFRHTVGTDMINNGMGLADVMTYLDHQSAEMTRNYTQIYDETLRRTFKELVLSGRAVGASLCRPYGSKSPAATRANWIGWSLTSASCHWPGDNACITPRPPNVLDAAECVLYQRQRSLPQAGHHAGACTGHCGNTRGSEKKPADRQRKRLGAVRQRSWRPDSRHGAGA